MTEPLTLNPDPVANPGLDFEYLKVEVEAGEPRKTGEPSWATP